MPPYARAWAHATRTLTRVERVRARGREYHAAHHAVKRGFCTVLVHGSHGLIKGPIARFCGWPIGWPSPAVLGALTGLKMALLGLCCGLAVRALAWPGLRCLFSLYEPTVLCGYTVHRRMA